MSRMIFADLSAIAQAALHELVIARLIIAMCEDNMPGACVGHTAGVPNLGNEAHSAKAGSIPAPGFSVSSSVVENINKFCGRGA